MYFETQIITKRLKFDYNEIKKIRKWYIQSVIRKYIIKK